ncbi:hypothetical protein HUG15_12270 [Salicibibacter cibarius]|uniref:Uncharacterized protein n=1 Tax=Salicibibacter cibarius TaxID=2743000 RepID=A0A7T6Z3K5_9BACI|nr:hypothetical protein [Salicibibacter cibarius]QQK76254.1 hypothetical protein HUG15_12270 [Salicibibacter cibarius]
MSDERNGKNEEQDDNFVKKTSKEATDLFGNTVDSAGRVIKSVSGEGGLVGKATDSSGKILKGTANKANDAIGKTSEAPGKLYRKARERTGKNSKHRDDE